MGESVRIHFYNQGMTRDFASLIHFEFAPAILKLNFLT